MNDLKWNWLVSLLILILNGFYFLPISVSLIYNSGDTFGFLILFFTVPLNTFIIPAILSFTKRYRNSKLLFYVNFFALITLALCYAFSKFMEEPLN